jgi:dolichol-phosphate mannosyltransferase
MAPPKTLIFIPTYCERKNVEKMCGDLLALGLDADLLFMDDNSPDGTGEVLDRLAERHPSVRVIHRAGKLGIGSAHLEAIAHAYAAGYERLATLDGDFTHTPADLRRLLEASDGHAVTVGSRYLRRGSLPGWNPFRRGLTLLAHVLTRVLLGLRCDASGALRVYDLKKVPADLFKSMNSVSYSFFFESLFVLANNGFAVHEIPIVLPARTYGSSKLNMREALTSLKILLMISLERKVNPGRFQAGRPIDRADAAVVDRQGWDPYWARKGGAAGLLYEAIAALYRQVFIRRRLEKALGKNFAPGAALLHAGCGSGQVDVGLHGTFAVTAVDISAEALALYAKNNPAAARIEQADILGLPFPEGAFDGVYNLGVMEHFSPEDIRRLLREFRRVLKPGGKVLFFWPHRRAASVAVLRLAHFVLNRVMKRKAALHPPEVSLLRGRREAEVFLREGGLTLTDYGFGAEDLFVQAVVTGLNPPGRAA